MAGLAEAVQGTVGQPASVRIGRVDSINPTVISAQGVAFNDVGLLDGYVPRVGDSVALLGQCSGAGSDPASWLALGAIQATGTPAASAEADREDALASTSSTVYVSPAVACAVSFVAPSSGDVLLTWSAGILTTSAGICYVAPQVTDSAGAVFMAASDAISISNPFASTLQFGSSVLVEGLTPGESYLATLMQRTSSGASPALAVNRNVAACPMP